MKISVIAWDASFRESLHTINFFKQQNYPANDFEFIWVDYYDSNDIVRDILSGLSNFKLLTLNHPKEELWNLGVMFNNAVKKAKYNNLLLIDGDIAVNHSFLQDVSHKYFHPEIVTYLRRYDEPKSLYDGTRKPDLERLTKIAQLLAPINYAGCAIINKRIFISVNGFEESRHFSGPGMIAKEFYTRLKNSGVPIRWAPDLKVYHPYHEGTLKAFNPSVFEKLKQKSLIYPWINPYSGLFQSWILRQREFNVDIMANSEQCDHYIQNIPKILIEDIFDKKYI
jgi:hypothetical protein